MIFDIRWMATNWLDIRSELRWGGEGGEVVGGGGNWRFTKSLKTDQHALLWYKNEFPKNTDNFLMN